MNIQKGTYLRTKGTIWGYTIFVVDKVMGRYIRVVQKGTTHVFYSMLRAGEATNFNRELLEGYIKMGNLKPFTL